MEFFLVVLVVFVFAYGCKFFNDFRNRKSEEEERPQVRIDIKELGEERLKMDDYEERYFTTIVAGLKYHIDGSTYGPFVGFAVPEPDNEYDKNAVMILNMGGRLLGYIPKDDLRNFKEWSEGEVMPCVGYYKPVGGSWHSHVKCIRPYTPDFVKEEIDKYMDWYKEKYL